MQKTLDLQNRIEIPLEIDRYLFAPSAQFLSNLSIFNASYSTELEVQGCAKWKPGTYKKIKDGAMKMMFPHWSTKSGANKIHKFRRYQSWSYDKYVQDLSKLDSEMYELRAGGTDLFSPEVEEEGTKWVADFNKTINRALKNTEIRMEWSQVPYYHTAAPSERGYENSGSLSKGSYPVIDRDLQISSYTNTSFYFRRHKRKVQDNKVDKTKMQNWYINILFPVKDVDIDMTIGDISHKTPFGDMVVGFSMNLDVLYRLNKLRGSQNFSSSISRIASGRSPLRMHTYTFPYMPRMYHPYVSSRSQRYHRVPLTEEDPGMFNTYDMGNTCFGDFRTDIILSLVAGQMGNTAMLINKWARNYPVRTVTPLNRAEHFVFGLNKNIKRALADRISIDTSKCKSYLDGVSSEEQAVFKEKFCDSCTLTTTCDTYIYRFEPRTVIEIPDNFESRAIIHLVETSGPNNIAMTPSELVAMQDTYMDYMRLHSRTEQVSSPINEYTTLFRIRGLGTGGYRGDDIFSFSDASNDMEGFFECMAMAERIVVWNTLQSISPETTKKLMTTGKGPISLVRLKKLLNARQFSLGISATCLSTSSYLTRLKRGNNETESPTSDHAQDTDSITF